MSGGFDLIVVGGGFAGLSAATAAAAAGMRVLVLEARPSLGGRAAAFTDPQTGERVDNGQHVLLGCYHETYRFLERIGTAAAAPLQPQLAVDVIDRDGERSRLCCPALPAPFHLLAGVMRWGALDWRDRVAVLRMHRALAPYTSGRRRGAADRPSHAAEGATSAALLTRPVGDADITVRDWLQRHGQTPRLIELLWEPLAVAALNQPIDTAAAAPFATVLGRMFGGGRAAAALALPRVPLDALYALPARDFIERRDGRVRVNAPARLVAGAGGCEVHVRGEVCRAPAVICGVAWHALDSVFPDPPAALAPVLDAARATPASPIVTVNLWFDRSVVSTAFVGLPGRTMQWVFDRRALVGEGASHLSLVSSGAESVVGQTNRALIDQAWHELCAAIPAAASAALMRAVVVREKRATFSVAPGQPPRPPTTTAVPGLYLAGDWIDTGLPATIESAVVSGHRAVAEALDRLQHHR